MSIRKRDEVTLDITEMAFGGRGIAKVDGFAVFVDQTAPGDRVKARIVRKKKQFAEARVLELQNASPDRIDPPCPYSGACGGCKWQFLAYDRQLEYKRRHVIDALERIGKISDPIVHPVIGSEPVFAYRNKMEFSCSDRRWLMAEELGDPEIGFDFALGLHVPGTFHKVLDIDACLLQPDTGNRILNDVKSYMKQSSEPPYGLKTHTGFWRFLMLRHSVAYDNWLVNIITADENREVVTPLAGYLMDHYDCVASVVNNITARRSGVAVGEYEIHLSGAPLLRERLGPFEFSVSANSFFQTNTRGAVKLYDTVRQYADLSGTETVVDLYSGTGTIPIWLSDSAASVIGIEIVESAVADAEKNCAENGVNNCRFVTGDIRECIASIDQRPDLMVIDPPRVGMHKDVVKAVTAMGPERMVYVSCNPATMARDLEMLKECYRLVEVQPVDMFPHTYHIESVAKLEKIVR